MKIPQILEVTLRDGSYVIDFQFTASDTARICSELERVGFDMIEVGHGIGMGASRAGKGQAAESDEAYLQVAADTLTKARWGMFCIPGIATLEDVDMAAEYGMKFIRIGTNVTEMEEAEPFIARAKKHGMYVSANFMKSYAMEPEKFAQKAILTQKFGSDILCIVDSAGGMLTSEMEQYFQAVQSVCDIPLGFHGHNNLELAVANSIRAVELGAVVIDTSLQGMGRSAGNTPTEIFLMVMERYGVRMGVNPLQVMDVGEKYIKPLIQHKYGYSSIDVVSGYSQFHSSYMGLIREFSSKHLVDPRRLIMAVCEENKVDANREMVERLAKQVVEESEEVFTARFQLHSYYGSEQLS
jgi:4-hydroxy 2-oxovalerate aldolase/long-chain acyl-CoA synthetase